mgnify:CR=1 FL=1
MIGVSPCKRGKCVGSTYQVVEIKVKVANFQLVKLSNGILLANFSELDGVDFRVDIFLELRLDLLNELALGLMQMDIVLQYLLLAFSSLGNNHANLHFGYYWIACS